MSNTKVGLVADANSTDGTREVVLSFLRSPECKRDLRRNAVCRAQLSCPRRKHYVLLRRGY